MKRAPRGGRRGSPGPTECREGGPTRPTRPEKHQVSRGDPRAERGAGRRQRRADAGAPPSGKQGPMRRARRPRRMVTYIGSTSDRHRLAVVYMILLFCIYIVGPMYIHRSIAGVTRARSHSVRVRAENSLCLSGFREVCVSNLLGIACRIY